MKDGLITDADGAHATSGHMHTDSEHQHPHMRTKSGNVLYVDEAFAGHAEEKKLAWGGTYHHSHL